MRLPGDQERILLKKEAGLAFIWILFLLAIMSALSLAFLQKVSIGRSATASRGSAMQAHYLARSAANHALWRLLNEPGFPSSETVYSMHSLDDGRYGYKVRRPTMTTFGTVATVGAAGNVVTKEGYVQYLRPYDVVTVYSRNSQAIPTQRRLLGANWSDPGNTVDEGPADGRWVILKGCPTGKEMMMGTLDSANDINFALWDGSTWGNVMEFTQDTGSVNYQCFDIAYENQSGDALVVGLYNTGFSVRYNIWNGTAWAFATPQEDAALQIGSTIRFIDMASKPNSDEILISIIDNSNDLNVIEWDGAAFNSQGKLDTDTGSDGYGTVEIVYEQQSGDALVMWTRRSSGTPYYSLWSGASLSPVAPLPFDFGGVPYMIRASADSKSDYIVVAAADKFYDLNVAVWDGDSWIDSREIETYVFMLNDPVFDIAWEPSGEDLVIAWASWQSGTNIKYFTWRKGTALADHTIKTGPGFQASPHIVRLYPVSGSQKIILLVENIFNDLRYSLWTGNTFLGNPPILLESDLSGGLVVFDVGESGVTYTGGSG